MSKAKGILLLDLKEKIALLQVGSLRKRGRCGMLDLPSF
jgi:hypothetical protein